MWSWIYMRLAWIYNCFLRITRIAFFVFFLIIRNDRNHSNSHRIIHFCYYLVATRVKFGVFLRRWRKRNSNEIDSRNLLNSTRRRSQQHCTHIDLFLVVFFIWCVMHNIKYVTLLSFNIFVKRKWNTTDCEYLTTKNFNIITNNNRSILTLKTKLVFTT